MDFIKGIILKILIVRNPHGIKYLYDLQISCSGSRLCCFIVLAEMGYGCMSNSKSPEPVYTFKVPMGYNFKYGEKDTFYIAIVLRNNPEGANQYLIYYQTDTSVNPTTILTQVEKEVLTVKNWGPFTSRSVNIYLELRQNAKRCLIRRIAEGTMVAESNTKCSKAQPCQMEVDLNSKCDSPVVNITNECSSDPNAKMYKCESFYAVNEFALADTIHQWYQVFNDGSNIGVIPEVRARKTNFMLKPEMFDTNTYVYRSVKSANMNATSNKTKIDLQGHDFDENYHLTIQNYTTSTSIEFDCKKYLNRSNTQVGIIDKTENHITTYNIPKLNKNFNIDDNGTILCCIFYLIKALGDTTNVKRVVAMKTVLFYNETPPFDDTGSELYEEENILHSKVFYIGVPVAGLILILILCIASKKLCAKKRNTDEPLELDTYPCANRLMYASLDLHHNGQQPPVKGEESPYAEVIGVIRPREKK